MQLMQRNGPDYIVSAEARGRTSWCGCSSRSSSITLRPRGSTSTSPRPVYGLVPDQVHLLLLVLLIQGEIDIVKGEQSYREVYETLPNPLQYDRILPGQALSLNQLRELQTLLRRIPHPGAEAVERAGAEARRRAAAAVRQPAAGSAERVRHPA